MRVDFVSGVWLVGPTWVRTESEASLLQTLTTLLNGSAGFVYQALGEVGVGSRKREVTSGINVMVPFQVGGVAGSLCPSVLTKHELHQYQ